MRVSGNFDWIWLTIKYINISMKWSNRIQTSKTGDRLYSDTSPYVMWSLGTPSESMKFFSRRNTKLCNIIWECHQWSNFIKWANPSFFLPLFVLFNQRFYRIKTLQVHKIFNIFKTCSNKQKLKARPRYNVYAFKL